MHIFFEICFMHKFRYLNIMTYNFFNNGMTQTFKRSYYEMFMGVKNLAIQNHTLKSVKTILNDWRRGKHRALEHPLHLLLYTALRFFRPSTISPLSLFNVATSPMPKERGPLFSNLLVEDCLIVFISRFLISGYSCQNIPK